MVSQYILHLFKLEMESSGKSDRVIFGFTGLFWRFPFEKVFVRLIYKVLKVLFITKLFFLTEHFDQYSHCLLEFCRRWQNCPLGMFLIHLG